MSKKIKGSYFRKNIDKNKGNLKGVWKALKTSGTSKPRIHIEELITENGITNDEAFVANELSRCLKNILERSGHDNGTDVEFDNTKVTHFVSSRLNAAKVFNTPQITPKQTIDFWVRVLKKIATVFAYLLCKLLNLSNKDKSHTIV